jgi:hypothetical protein
MGEVRRSISPGARVRDTSAVGTISTPTIRRRLGGQGGSEEEASRSGAAYPPQQPPEGAGQGGPPESGSDRPVENATPDGLNYVYEVTKNELDQQFRISERLDSKARGLFALAAAVFAAAQALALRPDVLEGLGKSDKDHLVEVATIAGGVLLAALLSTVFAIFVRSDKSVEPNVLIDDLNGLAMGTKSGTQVSQSLVSIYISLLDKRQKKNQSRAKLLWLVQILCVAVIAVSAWELILALEGLA